jgi:DNA-binding Lrp family transcriptional regulator
MDEILKLLRDDARQSEEDIAKMLGLSIEEVRRRIADYERRGVIRGYQAVIHEDSLELDQVTSVIEVKVTPRREDGFDHIAKRIAQFPEVRSLHLVSGTFDLLLFVVGPNLREVASFVSEKLAPLDGVTSTCSHFMLKTYKQHGLTMEAQDQYEKLKISP